VKHAIKKHLGDFIAVIALIAVALGVSYYIVQNQRLRIPYLEDEPFVLKAAFSTGQAVTPGQGQTVRLSGVRVGDISKVSLENGRAIITMDLDRKYEGLVRENWRALLRPKTGLKDMFIELYPGPKAEAQPAKEGWVMPIANTLPDVNPDEFFAALDTDTRDYLKLLLQGAADGLEGRSTDLADVLKRFEPTHRDIAAVQGEVAKKRTDLKRLVRALNLLNTELGNSDDELARVVSASARVFDAFAKERENVRQTVQELPTALAQTTETLEKVETMAQILGPASERLRPVARSLNASNRATLPFAREATPLIRSQIRPFVREARPLLQELRPAAHDLVDAEPELKRSLKVINRLFNMLAYNKDGAEPPDKAGRQEGFLFWLAWVSHQSVSIFSGQDANGVFRPFILGGTCNTLKSSAESIPGGGALLGQLGLFNDPELCGGQPLASKKSPYEVSSKKTSSKSSKVKREEGAR
jgi:phospholipid/cholesterol/gamma-HCH transport system substrate-binding protein